MCGIRARGSCMGVGKTVWNTLKEGETEKRGGESIDFKKGKQAGSRGGALKKGGGGGTPLQTIFITATFIYCWSLLIEFNFCVGKTCGAFWKGLSLKAWLRYNIWKHLRTFLSRHIPKMMKFLRHRQNKF